MHCTDDSKLHSPNLLRSPRRSFSRPLAYLMVAFFRAKDCSVEQRVYKPDLSTL
jgi:hypothetical protein